jgi:hypothetical protein
MSEALAPRVHKQIVPDAPVIEALPTGVAVPAYRRWLANHRTTRIVLPLLGALLAFPSLFMGFAQDDHFFLVLFKGKPGLTELPMAELATFSFGTGEAAANQPLFDRGILPWWTVPSWQVSFWRPLASLGHWLDYQLFGETAWPMHLHSLLAYALCIAVALQLYRRFIAVPWIAGLAAFLFAVDACHGIPVGWISNRNAIYSTGFALLALLAYDRARHPAGGAPGTALKWHLAALGSFGLALLSGEGAVGVAGYWVAYALVLDPVVQPGAPGAPVPWRRRLHALGMLLPVFLMIVVWRVVYKALGYGVQGSWLYLDPIADTVPFLGNLLQNLPVLFLGLFGGVDSSLFSFMESPWWQLQLGLGVVSIITALWVFWPLLRRDHTVQFLALGTLAGLIPACATIASDRLLFLCSFGMAGMVALLVGTLANATPEAVRSRRLAAQVLLVLHGVVSPILLLGTSYSIAAMEYLFRTANQSVPVQAADVDQTFVVVNVPLDLLGMSMPYTRSARSQPVPAHWWSLTAGLGAVQVVREDAHRLRLSTPEGFLGKPWAQIFRHSGDYPMYSGQVVELPGMRAEVLEATADGRPKTVDFTFARNLDDPTLTWLSWSAGVYKHFEMPAPGGAVEIPAISPMTMLWSTLGLKG